MKKILIISDTHGNHNILQSVLLSNQDCEFLIHLGDEPDDLDFHPDLTSKITVFSVYGLYHQKWNRQNACQVFHISNYRFVIAHAKEYLIFDNQKSVYCFGHTHNRYFDENEHSLFINPGHLKKDFDRNEEASYCVLEMTKFLTATYYNLDNQIIKSYNCKSF